MILSRRAAAGSGYALIQWAEARLRDCQRIALRYFNGKVKVDRKSDRSPVTVADRKIEEALRKALARDFPADGILGEEFGDTVDSAKTYWTIDPIDGTRGYTRGLPSWGMLLGRVENGRPTLGACLYPAIDTFIGVADGVAPFERAQGKRRRFAPAPRTPRVDDLVIFHGGARWWLDTPYAGGLTRLMRSCLLERAYGDCYGYLWALRGHVDVVLEYGVHPWDMVPFAAFANATGRVLVNFQGQRSFTSPDILFASPAAVKLVKPFLKIGRKV